MRFLIHNSWGILLGLLTAALPAEALEVKINPDNPQLGDTVSVTMETDPNEAPPQVIWGEQTYPVFVVENNQYRALIPTTREKFL